MAKKCAAKCATHHFGGCRNSHCMLLGARCMQHAVVVRVCICAERGRAMNAILFFGPACILRCCFCVHLFCFVFFFHVFYYYYSLGSLQWWIGYHFVIIIIVITLPVCHLYVAVTRDECSPFRALSERNKQTRHVQKFNWSAQTKQTVSFIFLILYWKRANTRTRSLTLSPSPTFTMKERNCYEYQLVLSFSSFSPNASCARNKSAS